MTNTTTTKATESKSSVRNLSAAIALQTAKAYADHAKRQAERTSEKIRVGK
jgi:hypothetical protein